MIHFLWLLQALAYRCTQVLPNFLLTAMANLCVKLYAHFPSWHDNFAPQAWFEPRPGDLPTAAVKLAWPLEWMGWNALDKIVVRGSVFASGVVAAVEVRPPGAEWQHDTYYLKLGTHLQDCLNRFNGNMDQSYAGTDNDLKVYVPVGSAMPRAGDRAIAAGDQVVDGANGWIGLVCAANAFTVVK